MKELSVVIRGAGDLATGVIQALWRSGFQVLALETEKPTAIRRQVALSSAITSPTQTMQVEDVTARHIATLKEADSCRKQGQVPLLVDPTGECLAEWKPDILIDAIIAKKNVGTQRTMAPLTIALGPGFCAPEDVTVVIETMRGHNLGRLIFNGHALPNTGTPGLVGGESSKRVVHAPTTGVVAAIHDIGDHVVQGEPLCTIDGIPVPATLTGLLRGLITPGMVVPKGMKIADIDPRALSAEEVFTISDKARALGGAVLQAILYMRHKGDII